MNIIPKFQRGGGFDSLFTVYTPTISLASRLETRQQNSSSKLSNDDEEKGKLTEKELFNMLKDLDGLPNDMSSIITGLVNLFLLENLTGTGIRNLATTYLKSLFKIRLAINNKKLYDKVKEYAIESGSMSEPAITFDGKLIVQDKNGNIGQLSLEEAIKNKDLGYNILTVSNLLNLREYSPDLTNNSSIFNIVLSSIGYESFLELLKQAIGSLGSTQITRGEATSSEELASKGLEVLQTLKELGLVGASTTSDDLYKYKIINKDQKRLIDYLTNYISALLPKNAKIWAALKLGSTNPEAATNSLIMTYLSSREDTTNEVVVLPISNTKSSSKNEFSIDDIELNTATKWLRGLGDLNVFTINPGTNYATLVYANTLPLTDKEKKYLGSNSLLLLATSGEYAGILDFSSVSMGKKKIDSSNFGRIILSDGKISSIDFPIEVLSDGTIIPKLTKEISVSKLKADKEIKQLGIDLSDINSISNNYLTINNIYLKYGLDPAYNPDGTPTEKWARFGVINATASNNALGMGLFDTNDFLLTITDDSVVENLLSITKEDFDHNDWYDLNGYDHFYRGTVWIPVKTSYIAASANSSMKAGEVNEIIKKEAALLASKALTKEKK